MPNGSWGSPPARRHLERKILSSSMSGALKKSPSEGDISSSVTDITAEESSFSKKEFSQKSYHPPDFKRGFLASTGFRLVWKTSNDGDITSLNRVLDLPQESKRPRSTSPKLVRSDYVFSEYFDPLAVLKRADSVEDEVFESMKELPDTENATTERKKHSDLEKIELPSVRSLKSLFENFKNQATTAGKTKSVKRSHTISGHETSYLKSKSTESRNDIPVERRHSSSSQPKISQTKAKSANEISVDAVAHESSAVTEEINERKEETKVKEAITISKSSSVVDIESGHIQRVKDLLFIFQNPDKAKSNSRSDQIKSFNTSEIKHKIQENSKALNQNHGEVTKIVFEKPVRITKAATEEPVKVGKAVTEEPIKVTKVTTEEPLKVTKTPTEESVKFTKAATKEPVTVSRSNNQESITHDEIVNKSERMSRTEDHIEIPSPTSVFNLRQKFEVLVSQNSLTEKDKEKTDNAQSNLTHKTTKIDNDSDTKTNRRYSKEKLELKLDLIIQTNQEVQTDVSRIERNEKFRRSVKNIALQYEAKTLLSKSAPVTPYTTPTTPSTNKPFSNIFSPISPPQSSGNKIYINQTIENSNKFSSETYVTPKEENRESKQNVGENTVLEKQNIRPLGSFEKQISVTKLKDRYTAKFEKNLSSQSLKNTEVVKSVKEVKTTDLSPPIFKDLETKTEKDYKEISHGNLQRQVSEKSTEAKEIPTLMKSISIPSSESQKEMSLGSLQRHASVTKMKEKYEIELGIQKSTQNTNHIPSQDSNKTFDKQKIVRKGLERQSSVPKLKDKYESQIQRHNSSPSLKNNINESLNQSNSTLLSENFETKAKNDKDAIDIDKNKIKIDSLNSGLTHNKAYGFENNVSESKAQDDKVKRKSQIEELVDSFIKSEGISQYLEVSTGENSLTSTEHKSRDTKMTTTETLKYINLQDHKLKESASKEYENSLAKNLEVSHEEVVKASAKTFEVYSKGAAKSSVKAFEESPKEAEKSAATFEASLKEAAKSSAKSFEVSAKEADKSLDKTLEISPKEAETSIIKNLPPSGAKSEVNKSSSSTTIIRAGSRELKPDELKYFQGLSAKDAISDNTQRRERSSSFDSGSPSTKTPKEDFTRSKLRSSSRQFRELHQDELKFFDSKINGTMSKMSFRTTSELALRQEMLEKTMRLSTENVERIE